MSKLDIFLLDDNMYFLNAAMDFFKTDPNINIMGYALKGEDALEKIKQEKPNVVIVDYVMAGLNGLEVTKILKTYEPPPLVIMVTQFDSIDYQEQALKYGADGFIPKSKFGEEVIPMIYSLLEKPHE